MTTRTLECPEDRAAVPPDWTPPDWLSDLCAEHEPRRAHPGQVPYRETERLGRALALRGCQDAGQGTFRQAFTLPGEPDLILKLGDPDCNAQELACAASTAGQHWQHLGLILAPVWLSPGRLLLAQPRAEPLHRARPGTVLLSEILHAFRNGQGQTPEDARLGAFLDASMNAGLRDLRTGNIGLYRGEWRLFDLHVERHALPEWALAPTGPGGRA